MSVTPAEDGTSTATADGRARASYRRLPFGQRRDEILAAALMTFATNPDASLGDVAEAAGISRTSIYRYFDTRQELLHAAFRQAGDELVARVHDMPDGPPSLILLVGLHNFFDHIEQVQEAFVGFLQAGSSLASEEIRAVADDVRRRIGAMVYEALQVTEATPVFDTTVRSWVAGVESVATHWLRTRGTARDELEVLLSSQLGIMLVNAATYDPVIAERVEWWMGVEPSDGPWAMHLQGMASTLNRNLVAQAARLMAGAPPQPCAPADRLPAAIDRIHTRLGP